jgi:hypothetical protein
LRTYTNAEITEGLSDHALVYTHVPVSSRDLPSSDFLHYTMSSDLRRGDAAKHTILHTPPHKQETHTYPHTPPNTTPHTTLEDTTRDAGPRCKTHDDHQKPPANNKTRYSWIGGDDTKEYMRSARTWKAHTSTDQFADKFNAISNKSQDDNETRTQRIEEFLIEEAITAGVV